MSDLANQVQDKAKVYADACHSLEVAKAHLVDWKKNVDQAQKELDSAQQAVDKADADLQGALKASEQGGS